MLHPIVEETVVPAPRTAVFAAFTSTAGATSFLAPNARIELAPDGPYEILFDAAAPDGERGSEGCRVLSWVEDEMVSFSWNAPPRFSAVRGERTFVVVQLFDDAAGGTLVRVTHGGWRDGDEWAEARAYFQRAWLEVLEELVERFRLGPRWEREGTNRIVRPALSTWAMFVNPVREGFFAAPTAEEERAVEEHRVYVRALLARDRLEFACRALEPGIAPEGVAPLDIPAPGIVVFRAEDEAAARRVAAQDPAVRAGVFAARLFAARIPFRRP
ncbi:MAG: SRPBCC domain-containing protein [Planctomycetota bacterium]